MKGMFVAVLLLVGLLAGCSDEKFAMEAKSDQRGAGSSVHLDGKEGVMTIKALAPDHPEGVTYHVTKTNDGALESIGNFSGYKTIDLWVRELNLKLQFVAVPQQGYLCVDCVWLKPPKEWALKSPS